MSNFHISFQAREHPASKGMNNFLPSMTYPRYLIFFGLRYASILATTLLPLEILPEGLIDDLGVGEAVEIGLAPDRLNPALFDMEGRSLNAFQVQNNARLACAS